MTAPIRRPSLLASLVVLTLLLGALVAALPGSGQAADTPRRGGVLLAVIGADAPSLDPHQESTFANLQMVAPLYSTLLQIDPYDYPKVIGDVATEWKVNYPMLVGLGEDKLFDAYGPLIGLPTSVIVGRDGAVCGRHVGAATKEEFEREIKALL